MSEVECRVYRSERHEGMYLYVAADCELAEVPEDLLKRFGAATEVMSLALSTQRKLARVDVNSVMRALRETGYFLQLPPRPGTETGQG